MSAEPVYYGTLVSKRRCEKMRKKMMVCMLGDSGLVAVIIALNATDRMEG
jgi:hypothetical protein